MVWISPAKVVVLPLPVGPLIKNQAVMMIDQVL